MKNFKKAILLGIVATMTIVFAACEGEVSSDTSKNNVSESTQISIETSSQTSSKASSQTSLAESSKSISTQNANSSANNVSSSLNSTSTVSSADANLSSDELELIAKADNAITWQIPNNGGWDKDFDGHIAKARTGTQSYITKGWTANGKDLGTIDNGGTYSEMKLIAQAYNTTKDATKKAKYKDSFDKAMVFLDNLQTEKGGFTQVYPKRGSYSDYVTINDNAMVSVMYVLQSIYKGTSPYQNIASQEQKTDAKARFDLGIDYLLKAQIVIKGVKSAWCAQHDPITYAPLEARDYERPSVSGSESIGVIELLMTQTDNTQAINAAMDAIRWFDSHKMENTAFNKNGVLNSETNKIEYLYYKSGSTLWYRFYDLNGVGCFSDRKIVTINKVSVPTKWYEYDGYFYDINEISEERRTGYSWVGAWPQKVIEKYL